MRESTQQGKKGSKWLKKEKKYNLEKKIPCFEKTVLTESNSLLQRVTQKRCTHSHDLMGWQGITQGPLVHQHFIKTCSLLVKLNENLILMDSQNLMAKHRLIFDANDTHETSEN